MKQTLQRLSIVLCSIFLVGCSAAQTQTSESVPEIKIPVYQEKAPITAVTVLGKPVTIETKMAQVGDLIVDVELAKTATKFDEVTFTKLSENKKVKVIYTAPSIDTPVCSLQTKELEAYAKKKTNVQFYMISADLPFAQSRFCSANKIDNLATLSDFKGLNWGMANGFAMKEYGLLTRSLMIVDENNVIQYIEYTSEVTSETNLGNALAYLEQVMKL